MKVRVRTYRTIRGLWFAPIVGRERVQLVDDVLDWNVGESRRRERTGYEIAHCTARRSRRDIGGCTSRRYRARYETPLVKGGLDRLSRLVRVPYSLWFGMLLVETIVESGLGFGLGLLGHGVSFVFCE